MATKAVDSGGIYKLLKKGGFLGEKYKGKQYKQLTAAQRGHITKLSAELKSVIINPANFVVRQIKNADTAKELKKQGYKVINGHAVIRVDFDGKASVISKKDKNGKRSVHVRITNKYEEKTSYKLRIQDLIASEIVPGWVRGIEAQFTARDSWAISIGGKPIGDFFQNIDSLLDYFESYLEGQLGEEDAAKCVLMHVKHLVPQTTSEMRTPRKAEIKAANKAQRNFRR